jgi:hypothetical protein
VGCTSGLPTMTGHAFQMQLKTYLNQKTIREIAQI